MTWCDKLASQPTIGFLFDPYWGTNDVVLTRLAPILEKWGTPEKPNFSVPDVNDIFSLTIQREDGFLFAFDSQKASVQFQHRMKLRSVSGGLPVAELISRPQVYTDLLDRVTDELIEVTLELPEIGRRHVRRLGIISSTAVSDDDLPPGIQRFIEYVSKPWKGLIGANFSITAVIAEDDLYLDRCIHNIARPEGDEALWSLSFDWQRYYKKTPVVGRRELERLCANGKRAALDYFEELAVGNAFDEHVE